VDNSANSLTRPDAPARPADSLGLRHAMRAVPITRVVSRISASTGFSRREVTRLAQPKPEAAPTPRGASLANELFARWLTDPPFRLDGHPRVLPRQGALPSFESQDVRPRSFLGEPCRLGIARSNEPEDTVELLRDSFVPGGNAQQMFGFLSQNVGDQARHPQNQGIRIGMYAYCAPMDGAASLAPDLQHDNAQL
jgi:hypothetical protein